MKKLPLLLLCLLMLSAVCTAAADYQAGDTVTISVSVSNPNKACAFDIGFSYVPSAFQYVTATSTGGIAAGPNGFAFAAWDPFAGGTIGTATFKVTDNAIPGKTYSISCYSMGAYNFDDEEVSIGVSVSGGSVAIKPAACTSHAWNSGDITIQPTCAQEGVRTYACTNAGCSGTRTEAIPKLTSHIWDNGIVTTQPTCSENGVKIYTCSVCKVTKTDAILASGHTDGEWTVDVAPTCAQDGKKILSCAVCSELLGSEIIPASGHDQGAWGVTQPATCQEDGLKVLQCTVCGEMLARETVPAQGHDNGKWIVTKPATRENTGLKELHCTRCDALLDTAVIPARTTDYYVRNTVCSFGPRFRDESSLTDAWYRFTPVDLSADGMQTFDLIASDAYVIGQVTVIVADGMVTIDYTYVSGSVKEHSTFCTLLSSLTETTALDPAQLTNFAFGQPISIADALGGDTKVLLFICNEVDYNSDMPVTPVYPNTEEYQTRIDELRKNMD